MSTAPPQLAYNPLGLPPGSVRALITLMIASLFWLLLALPERGPEHPPIRIPLFLLGLLPMVLLFFAAHGRSIRPEGSDMWSPLYLPRGLIRLLLVAGFAGVVVWQFYRAPELLRARLTPSEDQLWQVPWLLLAIGLGFLAGHLSRLGPWRKVPIYQNLVAWLSLVAMLLLFAEFVIELVIKPGLVRQWEPFHWECIVTGVVSLYFGARS